MDRDINRIIPVRQLPASPAPDRTVAPKKSKPAFQEALQRELARDLGLKLSTHAEKRLKERNIILGREDLTRIDQAVRQAEAKGARESLIIYGDLALIASIKNKTIVTALDGKSTADHVFTNIDSAVIVR